MVPAPVVSSGECDSQFTLSTALFVVLDATGNMKSVRRSKRKVSSNLPVDIRSLQDEV